MLLPCVKHTHRAITWIQESFLAVILLPCVFRWAFWQSCYLPCVFQWAFWQSYYCPVCFGGLFGSHVICHVCFSGLFFLAVMLLPCVFQWAFWQSCYCPECFSGLYGSRVIAMCVFSGLFCRPCYCPVCSSGLLGSHVIAMCVSSGLFGSHIIAMCVFSGLLGSHVIALCVSVGFLAPRRPLGATRIEDVVEWHSVVHKYLKTQGEEETLAELMGCLLQNRSKLHQDFDFRDDAGWRHYPRELHCSGEDERGPYHWPWPERRGSCEGHR